MTQTFAWNFAGTGQDPVVDLSGNGRGFTPTGVTTRTAAGGGYTYGGARPNAVGLTQTSAGAQVGPPVTGLQTTAQTICGWASIDNSSNFWFMEFHKSPEDTGVQGWLNLSFDFRFRMKNSSNTVFERLITPSTAFRFYAFTHDGTTLKAYQSNGVGVVAQVGADVAMAFPVWAATSLRVLDGSGPGVVLSDWQGFDTVMSLAQLQTLADTPLDDAGTEVTGTGSAVLPVLLATAAGLKESHGSGAALLPAVAGSAVAAVGVAGTGSAALGGVVAAATALRESHGSGNAVLPAVFARATVGSTTPPEDTAGWLTLGDLMDARATHEEIMLDRIGIRHPGMVEGEFDPVLGYAPAEPQPDYYDGKARVQARPVQSGQASPAGLGVLTTLGYAVATPVGLTADGAAPDDIVTVYESADPRLVGLQIVVRDVQASSFVTARRMTGIEYQPSTP